MVKKIGERGNDSVSEGKKRRTSKSSVASELKKKQARKGSEASKKKESRRKKSDISEVVLEGKDRLLGKKKTKFIDFS